MHRNTHILILKIFLQAYRSIQYYYLVSLRLSELFVSLPHADGGRLHIGLDGVNQLALLVNHGGEIFEYLVNIANVGLKIGISDLWRKMSR